METNENNWVQVLLEEVERRLKQNNELENKPVERIIWGNGDSNV